MTNELREFFAMGGYGLFVWSSYGLTALLLVGNLVLAVRRERRVIRELSRRLPVGAGHDPA
ncbi:MAG: heme exporter protein CcmD [Gammaproteobacteria bacterium]|nr:heme exporter protein CcmD [Gammaproteobacteria bacterium]